MRKLTNQQGDVLLFKVDSLPKLKNAKREKTNTYTVALGEHTGHSHVATGDLEVITIEEKRFVKSETPFNITHQEHGKQTIEPGTYEIGIVNEYDYDEEAVRKVQD